MALGAILSQGIVGSDKPISYASRTLNESELNYSTIEKELLAIVWATKYFRPYLFGRKFKIITDHKPLQWLMNVKEPNSRLTRWRLKLSEYNYTVIYKKGKSNTNADALSRIELHVEQTDEINKPKDARTKRPMTDEEMTDFVKDLLTRPSIEEDANSLVANPTERPPPLDESATITAHTDSEHPILEVPITSEPLNKFHRQICLTIVGDLKKRPTVTKPFETHTRTSVQLSESNLEEDLINAIKEFVHPKVKTALLITPPLGMYKIVPILQNKFRSSAMNLVLAKTELENVKEYLRQQDLIRHYHEGKTNHRGINECHLALSQRYFWPKMKDQITKFINECITCGQAKYDRNPIRQKFNLVTPATKPFETIHMDLFTTQNEKYVTFIDVFSKYGQAYHLRDGTAISVLQALLRFSSHHGLPLTIVTDNGTEFTNQLFAEFLRLHRITHHRTLAHSPNDNGNIERFHLTLLEHIRILKLTRKDEPVFNLMPYAIIAYNSSIHSLTKCRPYDVLTGHFDPRDPVGIDINEQLIQQYIIDHKERMQTVYNIINKITISDRTAIIENRNRSREPEVEYRPQQQVFIKNPAAARQKIAPRYTHDKVLADLPIHIYTSKKRGPVAKSRLKRVPKSAKLLQNDPDSSDNVYISSPGDKT